MRKRKNSFGLSEMMDIKHRVETGESFGEIAAFYDSDIDELRTAYEMFLHALKNIK